jgi:hypothetical protein
LRPYVPHSLPERSSQRLKNFSNEIVKKATACGNVHHADVSAALFFENPNHLAMKRADR